MVVTPDKFTDLSTYELLDAVARGKIGFDHRVLRVILDRGKDTVPDLVRWGTENHDDLEYDVSEEIVSIFRHLRTAEAMPFFVEYIRREPREVSDEVAEALYPIREAAIGPLLKLYDELGEEDGGEVAFLLASFRVRDDRILRILLDRLEYDLMDATIALSLHGDPAAGPALQKVLGEVADDAHVARNIEEAIAELGRADDHLEPEWNIWDDFPETSLPEFENMDEAERLEYLAAPDVEYRLAAAESCVAAERSERLQAALFERAQSDDDPRVRGKCWEVLSDETENKEIRDAMLARLRDEQAPLPERSGALLGLCTEAAKQPVRRYVEEFYAGDETRAVALQAMWGSMDRSFGRYFPKHLDDADPKVVMQAIAGVGYLRVHDSAETLRKFFDMERYRSGALFAYALAVRHEVSRGRIRALHRKVEQAAGDLTEEEDMLVQIALDQRLLLHGLQPVFNVQRYDDAEDAFDQPVTPPVTAGRNDPCPCGSGKKFKRCCGA